MFSPYRTKPLAFQLRKLSAAVTMAMLFTQAEAAGWGDLTVLSSLGQPLRADIELVSTSPQDDGALAVRLAGADAYRRANIEFNPVLMSLRFAVEQRGGRHIVQVTSTQAVNEPFVDMLLELHSSSGRTVREFVFLLDPAADGGQVAAVTPANASVPAPIAAPVRKPAPARAPAAQVLPASTGKSPAARTAAAQPRLTLTGVTAVSATDSKAGIIALDDYATMEKQVAEANARVKALEQKVDDLQKLLAVTNTLLAELQKHNANAAIAEKAAPQPQRQAPLPVADAKPAALDTAPVSIRTAQPAPAPVKAAAPPADDAPDYLIPGAGLLASLFGAAGIYASRRRKAKQAATAGAHDDAPGSKSASANPGTAGAAALATGFMLPAAAGHAHEVDPLAEADVYIAYGRDVQAEDILKEALNRQPDRHPVRVKLLSIYAGRKDQHRFDALARELHGMTRGEGADWLQAAELGREIDPANALYAASAEQPAAPVPELVLERRDDAPAAVPLPDLTPTEEITPVAIAASPGDVDFDLDNLEAQMDSPPAISPAADDAPDTGPGPIDFDLIRPAEMAAEDFASIPELPVVASDDQEDDGNLIDFDFLKPEVKAEAVPDLPQAVLAEAPAGEALLDLDFLKPAQADEQSKAGSAR